MSLIREDNKVFIPIEGILLIYFFDRIENMTGKIMEDNFKTKKQQSDCDLKNLFKSH